MSGLPDKFAQVFKDWIRGLRQEESSLEIESRGFWAQGRAAAIEAIFTHRVLDIACSVREGQPRGTNNSPTVELLSLTEVENMKNSVRRAPGAAPHN